jgi:hypothetical protein
MRVGLPVYAICNAQAQDGTRGACTPPFEVYLPLITAPPCCTDGRVCESQRQPWIQTSPVSSPGAICIASYGRALNAPRKTCGLPACTR